MIHGRCRALTGACLAAFVLLAGCSHDSAGIHERKSSGVKMVTSALGKAIPMRRAKEAATPPNPTALATAALGSIKGPVIMVTFSPSS